ncbi:MAG: hypothetical protein GXP61_06800 [Epsilonproteobacteria bacterium]|nr:hypothetical protein [Campylobacterota bacterium]
MNLHIIDQFITFLITHKELAYIVLFMGSMFETVIGFSFFIYGEIFFLSGSVLAGMGILNIWFVMAVLYLGGITGDNISYFLGRKYGLAFYSKLKNVRFFKKYINKKNLTKGVRFFRKYGALSVFFGRLLGPISWITPFVVGAYKLEYRKFLPYEIMGVTIGIGQFIIVGYFFGRHFDVVLKIIETYVFILLFFLILVFILYFFLKKKRILYNWKLILKEDRKKIIKHIIEGSFKSLVIIFLVYILFLFFIFFVDNSKEKTNFSHSYDISLVSNLQDYKKLSLYYLDSNKSIVQPINITIKTTLDIKDIVDHSWLENDIFRQNNISFIRYVHLLEEKVLPVSSLYFIDLPQNFAYQYQTDSLSKREHIRFWVFSHKKSNLKTYYASISFDNGYEFSFYNYFITPIHKIDKNVDKSRDFFYKYLLSRKDLKVECHYFQTKLKIKKINEDKEVSDEQKYYTDGKILECQIEKRYKGK